MDITLFKQGLIIMVIGMGTVFFFLTIMICAMKINEYVLNFIEKYFPEELTEVKSSKPKNNTTDEEVAVVIAAAVNRAQRA